MEIAPPMRPARNDHARRLTVDEYFWNAHIFITY